MFVNRIKYVANLINSVVQLNNNIIIIIIFLNVIIVIKLIPFNTFFPLNVSADHSSKTLASLYLI